MAGVLPNASEGISHEPSRHISKGQVNEEKHAKGTIPHLDLRREAKRDRSTFSRGRSGSLMRTCGGFQVEIRAEWVVLEQIPFTSLSKLSYDAGEAEDMCG